MRIARTILPCILLLAGCSATGVGPDLASMNEEIADDASPPVVAEHVRQVSREPAVGTPVEIPSLEAMKQQIEAIQKDVDKMVADPASVALFRDFRSKESRARQELSKDLKKLASAVADGLDRAELEAYVFARNPDVKAAERRLRSTVERYPQVVYVETILAQYVTFLSELMLGPGPAIHRDPVAMKYPAPGVLSLKADLVSREVDIARSAYEKTVRDTIVAADTTLFELWYVTRALAIENEVLGYLKLLERTVSSRLETGKADKSQVLQVQVEISSLEDDVITLKERRSTAQARLRELLDLAPETPVGPAEIDMKLPATPESERLYATAREHRQEIRMARDKLRRVETAIALSEKMTYPDFTLGLGYFRGIEPVGTDRPAVGAVPKGFPSRPAGARTFWFGRNEAFLREVRTLKRSLASDLEAETRRAEYLVKRTTFALDEARRKLRLYEDILIAQARQAYEDTLAGYQSDRVEFLNIIDTLRQWLRFDLERDRARRDYLTSFVRIEAAVGTPLEW